MGVAPDSKICAPSAGDIVLVRRGKHGGTPFVVIKVDGVRTAWITDGKHYPADRPKKKNFLHLQRMRVNLEDVAERVASGKALDNGWLVQRISAVMKNGDASCRQGG